MRLYNQPTTPSLTPCQSQEPGKLVTITVRDYDHAEVSKLVRKPRIFLFLVLTFKQLRSAYMGIAIMAVMHGYFKFTQPLFVQALMGVKGIFDAKKVVIHLLGKPATGEHKRPFAAASLMSRMLFLLYSVLACSYSLFVAATGPKSDAASIAEAEKRAGSKKED